MGDVLFNCQAGCTCAEVCTALEVQQAQMFAKPKGHRKVGKTTIYEYTDATGTVTVHREVRTDYPDRPKRIRQYAGATGKTTLRQRREAGDPVQMVLYKLRDVLAAAQRGERIWITEGAKGAEDLIARGEVATTVAGGAKAPWLESYSDAFVGAEMVGVIADRDTAGYGHALKIAGALRARGIRVRVYCSRTTALGDDIVEHFADGGTIEDLKRVSARTLRRLIDEAAESRRVERQAVRSGNVVIGEFALGVTTTDGRVIVPPLVVDATEGNFDTDEVSARRSIRRRSAAEIPLLNAKWLHDELVPLGALTLVAGHPSVGKSTLASDYAAKVTRGELDGEYKGKPRAVLVVATEESWSTTIAPRLTAMGADLSMVFELFADVAGYETPLDLSLDVGGLEAMIRETGAALVIFDPLMSRLSSKVDTHKDAEVRRDLEPLTAMLDRTGCAALALIHLNKGDHLDPLNAVMGSKAFTAVARSVIYVAKDPNQKGVVLVGQPKSNLGPEKDGVDTFTFETAYVQGQDERVKTTKIVWGAHDERSVDDIVAETRRDNRGPTVPQRCAEWLVDYLRELPNRQAELTQIIEDGRTEGWTRDNINAARRDVLRDRIKSQRARVKGGNATWQLVEINRVTAVQGGS